MLVRPVARERPEVGPAGNVRPVVQLEEQLELGLQARFDELRRD